MTRDGDRVSLSGPINLQTVPAVLRFGLDSFADGARIVRCHLIEQFGL